MVACSQIAPFIPYFFFIFHPNAEKANPGDYPVLEVKLFHLILNIVERICTCIDMYIMNKCYYPTKYPICKLFLACSHPFLKPAIRQLFFSSNLE